MIKVVAVPIDNCSHMMFWCISFAELFLHMNSFLLFMVLNISVPPARELLLDVIMV